jgi:hypothetical protein
VVIRRLPLLLAMAMPEPAADAPSSNAGLALLTSLSGSEIQMLPLPDVLAVALPTNVICFVPLEPLVTINGVPLDVPMLPDEEVNEIDGLLTLTIAVVDAAMLPTADSVKDVAALSVLLLASVTASELPSLKLILPVLEPVARANKLSPDVPPLSTFIAVVAAESAEMLPLVTLSETVGEETAELPDVEASMLPLLFASVTDVVPVIALLELFIVTLSAVDELSVIQMLLDDDAFSETPPPLLLMFNGLAAAVPTLPAVAVSVTEGAAMLSAPILPLEADIDTLPPVPCALIC